MRKEIEKLRKSMRNAGVDIYYVPYGDFHCSEYVSDYFKVTEFLTGFTGESATLVVSGEGAWLWTDGRFFIQAEKQLAGTGIELMKMGEEGVPSPGKFIAEMASDFSEEPASEKDPGGKAKHPLTLGFDGRTMPGAALKKFRACFEEAGAEVRVKSDEDLAGGVWKERPGIEPGDIWELPVSSAGKSAKEKIADVREAMAEEGADFLLLTDLMETAWLFNLRGSDIAYTPVFFSFTLIGRDSICLYLMKQAGDLPGSLYDRIPELKVKAYEDIYDDLKALDLSGNGSGRTHSVWLDSRTCNHALMNRLYDDIRVIDKYTPAAMMKIVKNETEIACSRNAHIKDGVAVTKFIKWLKDEMKDSKEKLTEMSAADRLLKFREEAEDFLEPSFETISAYGANGAIVHYAPTEETNAAIRPKGFLLLDSGGQYTDGTTDITRTIALGSLTREMIEVYTYVLKAHIAMAKAEISGDMDGTDVDRAARKPLQDRGMDFNHGLSHGVGHVLGVHEGPGAVAKKEPGTDLKAGMIMSDEPGVYLEDRFGVRIENLVLWKESGSGSLVNEPLTCVPYERDAIDVSLLSGEEIEWIDDYHKWVRKTLAPLLDEDTRAFLEKVTRPLF